MRGLVRVLSVVSGLLVLYSFKKPRAWAQGGVNAERFYCLEARCTRRLSELGGASESGLARTSIRKGGEVGRGWDES